MFDHRLRPLVDRPLHALARPLTLTANQVTIGGFATGLLAVPAIATGWFSLALITIGLNRLADGLDGALARRDGPTDFGAYLDIVLDFLFYSAVPFAFVLYNPANGPYAAFLIFSFIATGTTFLAFSALAAHRGLTTELRGKKSIYYLGGLTEGFETIVALCLMCIAPAYFWLISSIFGIMCWITAATRIAVAREQFS
ncbi:MAG: CDP-alcohol phosphatidyltransferase [Gammaproteobacteria bacterium]|nr:CDP-alcohol phosphatidyltransferase [Gammaproteobacteria bacterium]